MVAELQRQLATAGHPLAQINEQVYAHILAEFLDAPRLLRDFQTGGYRGDVLFFRALQRPGDQEACDPQLWQPYVTGKVVVHDVNSTHNGMLSREVLGESGALIAAWLAAHSAR